MWKTVYITLENKCHWSMFETEKQAIEHCNNIRRTGGLAGYGTSWKEAISSAR